MEIGLYVSETDICTTNMDKSLGIYWSTSFCAEIAQRLVNRAAEVVTISLSVL